MTALMASVTTGASLIIVQLIISKKQQRITDVKNEYVIKEVQSDIKRLEEKQDKHNSLMERTAVIERDLKTAFKKIDELNHDLERHEDQSKNK